jgi:phenylalanyl-tRNA synthetase beta chain
MVTSMEWIRAYVPGLNCTDQEFYDRMTLSGTKVEGWKRLDKNLDRIVVGQVLSMEKHPDSDHLWICQVDVGSEKIQIVTGAQNLKTGDLVPTVLDGGRVAGSVHDEGPLPENGIKIKAGKLRGVESYGMMCGIEELGSDRNAYPDAPENGIYVFPEGSVKPGDDAVEALGMHDSVFEYEITNNRVDCYSMLGIAREAAVTFDLPFKPPVVEVQESQEKTADYISVDVQAPDLCRRYCARVCTGIRIAPSPEWMQRRLRNSGIRPINNLVDITNYIMLEYGQPMHAYDLDTVSGHKIIVRRAKDGDVFRTLDGQDRNVDSNTLMICDAEKEIGIAGIMGGENSMITDHVKTVLFEAATFDGTNIRKASRRIGLQTDASGIFTKGLDPVNAKEAIDRACQLMNELGCGSAAQGTVDVCQPIPAERRIKFEPDVINRYLGTDIAADKMLEIFRKEELGFDKETKEVVVPSFRQDLKAMCDLSEEVARFSGYDNVPSTLPESAATIGGLSLKLRADETARNVAESNGFSEAMTYSFESPKVFDKLLYPADAPERKAIRISNPLGEDFSIMRTTPLAGMLTSLSTNYNRRNKDVRLYELAGIYLPKQELPITDYADERVILTLGMYGEGDFYELKGVVEDLFTALGITKAGDVAKGRNRVTLDPKSGKPFFHPGRQADILFEDKCYGCIGEIHPTVAANFDIEERVCAAMIDMTALLPLVSYDHHYDGIAKFPAVSRDISMVVPTGVSAGDIENVISQRGGKILESFHLFDIYEGAQILKGFKSMAYSITFRDREKTLQDEEVNTAMKKILNGLQGLGIELRS